MNKKDDLRKEYAEEFFHSLIHELRRPVIMGTGYIETLLQADSIPEEVQLEFQEKISHQFKEITRLLDEYQQKFQDIQV